MSGKSQLLPDGAILELRLSILQGSAVSWRSQLFTIYYLESSSLLALCCRNATNMTTAAHKKLQGTTRAPGPCSCRVTSMPCKRGSDSAPWPLWGDHTPGQRAWGKLSAPSTGSASPKTCAPRATMVTDSIKVRWCTGGVSGGNGVSPQVILPCTD